jgi:hypothetical protein
MPSTQTAPVTQEPTTLSFSEADYLREPYLVLAHVSAGRRVQLLAADGSVRGVIHPSLPDIHEDDD